MESMAAEASAELARAHHICIYIIAVSSTDLANAEPSASAHTAASLAIAAGKTRRE